MVDHWLCPNASDGDPSWCKRSWRDHPCRTVSHHFHISTMAKTKQKGITYTPPTKKQFPQLYKLKEKTTTRGSRSSWVKDSWSPKTKSVGSSPTKSPLKEKSSTSQMLYEGDDFGFDQGDIPQPKLPKSLASSNSSHSHFWIQISLVHKGSKWLSPAMEVQV